jgi:hypothetical protein
MLDDAPPISLMDSTTSPKVNTTEAKRVRARSLACNISRLKGMLKFQDRDYEE